jgi:hypothetical protein
MGRGDSSLGNRVNFARVILISFNGMWATSWSGRNIGFDDSKDGRAPDANGSALGHAPLTPFTAILGVITGSLVSLAFGLGVTLVVFFVLRDENPRFSTELPELVRAAAMFGALAGLSWVCFIGTLKGRQWRHWCLSALWVGLLLAGWYYWPA